jgi:uncharacterized SAM-binding protein YcdF (DUF218 family)
MSRRQMAMGAVLLAAGAWCGGFVWFAWNASRPATTPPVADGIVVLTGGADRVATAFRLLEADRGGRLLVSGVARGTDLPELARSAGISAARLAARTTLGHAATTTRGNADETRDWARSHGIHSLIVVTAGYHMPRALVELGRELPGVALYPVPVLPPALRGGPDVGTLRLLAAEYVKWCAAELGLTRLQGIGQPSPADAVHQVSTHDREPSPT